MNGSRIIAITDIHGESGKLNDLIAKLHVKPDDTIVFMGDYIDRGPDSKGARTNMRILKHIRVMNIMIIFSGLTGEFRQRKVTGVLKTFIKFTENF